MAVIGRFWGLLSNGSDVLSDREISGLRFEKHPIDSVIPVLHQLTLLPEFEIHSTLSGGHYCTDEKDEHVYLAVAELPGEETHSLRGGSLMADDPLFTRLSGVLQTLRLLVPSAISCPAAHVFSEDTSTGRCESVSSVEALWPTQQYQPFELRGWTWSDLLPAVAEWIAGPRQEFVDTAAMSFEHSFAPGPPATALISLVTSLETILNPSRSELRFRVSRGVGVLLGETRRQARVLQKEAKRLYDLRSKVVHAGKGDEVTWSDVGMAREVASRVIRAAFEHGGPKQDFCVELEERGFPHP